MATYSRRRSVERKKTRPSSSGALIEFGPRGWADEILAVVFFALAIFLTLSLLSHWWHFSGQLDPVTFEENNSRYNMMGPVGNVTATILSGLMGWCALVPVVWAAWLGVFFWRYDENNLTLKIGSRFFLFLGLLSMLIFTSALASLFGGERIGGTVGDLISQPLIKLFSTAGSALLLGVGLLLSLAVVSQRSVADLANYAFLGALSLARLLFVYLPLALLRVLHVFFFLGVGISKGIFLLVREVVIRKNSEQSNVPDEIQELPKPRRRQKDTNLSKSDKSDSLSEDMRLTELDEDTTEADDAEKETYSHVVVSRKKSDLKLSGGSFRSLGQRVEKLSTNITPEVAYIEYRAPDISLLTKGEHGVVSEDDQELIQTSKQIESKLKDFGILGRVTQVHPGPVITLYEFEPAPGVKVGRISALQDDLAMSLKAVSIRIIAPIPQRGTVGIEVPNRNREIVRLRDVLESEAFVNAESTLSVPLGKDTYGEPVVFDIALMPHLLMAGSTGTGKSVCINAILLSLLYRATPDELGLILIDPKILELSIYEGIPHLKVPVVTNAKQAKAVLDWAAREMERRYRLMQRFGVRSIDGYNRVVKGEPEGEVKKPVVTTEESLQAGQIELTDENTPDDQNSTTKKDGLFQEKLEPLPKIVIVIDELADLMLAVGREIEELITRLAQKARAAGIHLIVATQRPSVDVITGLIKANFPARLSFRVSSRIDSRTILDSMGAEKLLGRGDLLFMAPGSVHLKRIHGAFVSDSEVKKVVESLKQATPRYDERIMKICEEALQEEKQGGASGDSENEEEYDSFYDKAVELVVEKGQASTSMIQRAFRIGYNRAARIIEMMERDGVIGPMDGVKPREVLIQDQEVS